MNNITLLPSSKSLIENASCCCNRSYNSKYSGFFLSFRMDPYYNDDKILRQMFLIFKNNSNCSIPMSDSTIVISLIGRNGTCKTETIECPRIRKQGCYITIDASEAFFDYDFESVESISCLIKCCNFTNADYCALSNMGVVCRLGFKEVEMESVLGNALEVQGIIDLTKCLESLEGENIYITTVDSTLNEYSGCLKCISCPYYITLSKQGYSEIIPINKITAVSASKIACIDIECLASNENQECCFVDKLSELKGKNIRLQLEGLGEKTNTISCKIKSVAFGVSKCKSNNDFYIVNNYRISRIIASNECCKCECECNCNCNCNCSNNCK